MGLRVFIWLTICLRLSRFKAAVIHSESDAVAGILGRISWTSSVLSPRIYCCNRFESASGFCTNASTPMCRSERCIRLLIRDSSARFGVIQALRVLADLGFCMLQGISACMHPMMATWLSCTFFPVQLPMIVVVSFQHLS